MELDTEFRRDDVRENPVDHSILCRVEGEVLVEMGHALPETNSSRPSTSMIGILGQKAFFKWRTVSFREDMFKKDFHNGEQFGDMFPEFRPAHFV